ncbi:MAG TPA: hypothetical protein VF631_13240 [Allosphingosinicella sp.]|jgi:hypothetical protein|uniref:hypothetical protein n=1 Tax=Allosphingosinicella sp. TaxID=2823234 RepID=UPI002F28A473
MKSKRLLAALAVASMVSACASVPAMPDVAQISDPAEKELAIAKLQAVAPKPLEGNGGKFMSPFTSDGVTAEWVTKAMKVKASGELGQAAGQIAGDQLLSNIPFAGMFAGEATKKLARDAAMKSIGGEEFLKSSSDQSFDTLEDMAGYMYAYHATHADYAAIVEAAAGIYPEFGPLYYSKYPKPQAPKKEKKEAEKTS